MTCQWYSITSDNVDGFLAVGIMIAFLVNGEDVVDARANGGIIRSPAGMINRSATFFPCLMGVEAFEVFEFTGREVSFATSIMGVRLLDEGIGGCIHLDLIVAWNGDVLADVFMFLSPDVILVSSSDAHIVEPCELVVDTSGVEIILCPGHADIKQAFFFAAYACSQLFKEWHLCDDIHHWC